MSKYYYVLQSSSSSDSIGAQESRDSSPPTLSEVGGKALSLYNTSKTFPNVPYGLVLTVAFFQPWLDMIKSTDAWRTYASKSLDCDDNVSVTKDDCDALKEQCKHILSLNDEQTKLLEEAVRATFGPDANITNNLGIVAVRSSSPEEDLEGTSFAGRYETTLGVTSTTLQSAILNSFASLFDHRVHLYKKQHGIDTATPRIAIIIQRQIDSAVSGVAFSINPNNNCYDEIMISANNGLGESVVGGIVTPDTYIVDRYDPSQGMKIVSKKVAEKKISLWLNSENGGTYTKDDDVNEQSTAQALTDEQILEVANLVARVEEEWYGGLPAVDTEWAFDNDGKLYLLQARPVTGYVQLFPEMITKRGKEKKLYLDIMVMVSSVQKCMRNNYHFLYILVSHKQCCVYRLRDFPTLCQSWV